MSSILTTLLRLVPSVVNVGNLKKVAANSVANKRDSSRATGNMISIIELFKIGFNANTTPDGDLISKDIWKSSQYDAIAEKVAKVRGPLKGRRGYHGSCKMHNLLEQALSNPDNEIQQRENKAGEGLYLGSAEQAFHFTGGKVSAKAEKELLRLLGNDPLNDPTGDNLYLAEIGSTNDLAENTNYGTNTTYILPNTGTVHLMRIVQLNQEYVNFVQPSLLERISNGKNAVLANLNEKQETV